jgi:hypothetical protein
MPLAQSQGHLPTFRHGCNPAQHVRDRTMTKHRLSRRNVLAILSALPVFSEILPRSNTAQAQPASADPLPSWNDGATKQSILDFVAAVTREGSPDFVPGAERIATFDNDGTLWVEHPMYT